MSNVDVRIAASCSWLRAMRITRATSVMKIVIALKAPINMGYLSHRIKYCFIALCLTTTANISYADVVDVPSNSLTMNFLP